MRLLDEPVDHRKAKAGSGSLGGEERFGRPLEDFRRHALTFVMMQSSIVSRRQVVRSGIPAIVVEVQGRGRDRRLPPFGIASRALIRTFSRAISRCTVSSVQDRQPGLEIEPEVDLAAQGADQHLAEIDHQRVEVNAARVKPLLPREGEKLLGQLGALLGRAFGMLDAPAEQGIAVRRRPAAISRLPAMT